MMPEVSWADSIAVLLALFILFYAGWFAYNGSRR